MNNVTWHFSGNEMRLLFISLAISNGMENGNIFGSIPTKYTAVTSQVQ
jgi:hypothetical protein